MFSNLPNFAALFGYARALSRRVTEPMKQLREGVQALRLGDVKKALLARFLEFFAERGHTIVPSASLAIERHAELRRPLEDVEELSERQPEQREDHGDGVQLRQKDKMQPAHQVGRDRQEDARDRHREEHHEPRSPAAEETERPGQRL